MQYIPILTTIVSFAFTAGDRMPAMGDRLARAGLPDFLYLSEFLGRQD